MALEAGLCSLMAGILLSNLGGRGDRVEGSARVGIGGTSDGHSGSWMRRREWQGVQREGGAARAAFAGFLPRARTL